MVHRATFVALALFCFVTGKTVVLSAQQTTPSFEGGDVPVFESGNRLHDACEARDLLSKGFCAGYITGVVDALRPKELFCLPQNATVEQVADIVKLWLRDHPERRQEPAQVLTGLALLNKFPCH
jgi:Rap1a immunity proteins